jgi:hypothetical protein
MKMVFRFGLVLGLLLALFFAFVALSACSGETVRTTVEGSGNVASEDRAVSGITGVALGTLGDLTIELGDQESLRVEADDNLLQYLKTTLDGGTLTIAQDPAINLAPKESIHYYLTVKKLESIGLSSVGSIAAPALTATHFVVELRSTGNIRLAGLQTQKLDVHLSSTGNVIIDAGEVGSQDITLSSTGDYEAGDVRSTSADVHLSSSGNATIWVTDRLETDLSSSGSVRYYGNPTVSVDASSSGKAEALGAK